MSELQASRQGWLIGISWGLFGALLGVNLGFRHLAPSLEFFSPGWWQVSAPIYAALFGIMGWGVAMSLRRRTEPVHRFYLGLSGALLVYFVVLFVGVQFLRDTPILALRLAMALLPAAALAWVLREHVRYVESLDELQRLIEHRALLVAAGVVAMTSVAAGFLQVWGLLPRGGLLLIWPQLYFVWAIARFFIGRSYRG